MDADSEKLRVSHFSPHLQEAGIYREHSIHIGDMFSVGSAEVVRTQPRLPSYKPRG